MSQALWGGRFVRGVDPRVFSWAESLSIDEHMCLEDMWGSIGHVAQLAKCGILPDEHARKILKSLGKLYKGYQNKEWCLLDGSEFTKHDDTHMNVEARVIADIGMESGGRMHTARSRNDQVPTATKLRARELILELRDKVMKSVKAFLVRAEQHVDDVMVGYTHVQHAQPVSIAFWLTHYAAALLRDLDRLKRAYDVVDECPLGAGAYSTTSYPIDRALSARLLGFHKPQLHALDATGNRDFLLEVASSVAILQSTFSRLAEEFIMWSSHEFRALTLDDGFAMGSSMMPQKKNPGPLELLRGRTGRINGSMVAAFTMVKGLPSGYNRDFHEEKEILHEQLTLINRASAIVPALIETTTINKERMKELTFLNFSTATELANFLVQKHDVPFRTAHHIVGSLVGELSRSGRNFSDYAAVQAHLKKSNIEATTQDLEKVLDGAHVIKTYNALGGTGPEAVRSMMAEMNKLLDQHSAVLAADRSRVDDARALCLRIAEEGDWTLAK